MFKNWKSTNAILVTALAVVLASAGMVLAKKPTPEPPPEPPPIRYSFTPLGTLDGNSSKVEEMNKFGDVVGFSQNAVGRQAAFLSTTDGDGNRLEMINLNDLIDPTSGWHLSTAKDINDLGEIVGSGYLDDKVNAFLYRPGEPLVDFSAIIRGKLGTPDRTVFAEAINNDGDIIGHTTGPDGNSADYLYLADTGNVVELPPLDAYRARAESINNRQDNKVQVAGYLVDDEGMNYHAFRYTYAIAAGTWLLEDLGALRKGSSWASDMNDLGEVVGGSYAGPRKYHAFVYTDNTGMIDLGTLGGKSSDGRGINSLGDIVGWATTDEGVRRAFLYTKEYGMTDLENLIVDLPESIQGTLRPEKINDFGEISGTPRITRDDGSHTRGEAFVLTPIPDEP